MANNIVTGLNFVVAGKTDTWQNIGLTTANTVEIYGTSNGNAVSYRPGKLINTLQGSGVVQGVGYMLNSKIDRDMNDVFFSTADTPASFTSDVFTTGS